tara:strand:- start:293 stop:808 length:516 start_codon:yes stop_codon:yes gene_type:complete
MIVTCNNCRKNFNVDSNLIYEKGRLLQCNSCDHKWFFKKKLVNVPVQNFKKDNLTSELEDIKTENSIEKLKPTTSEKYQTIPLLDNSTNNFPEIEKILSNEKIEEKNKIKNKKNYNVLGLTFVFIISFVALIIIVDTFNKPIGKIVPNIEFLLYNLYESIKDIVLFLRDLI